MPLECLHTYSAWHKKGSRGVLGGPTEHFIQVAMHVREMKACKWLPVIVSIKEQLRPVVSTAAVFGLPPCLIFRWTSSKGKSFSALMCLWAGACLCVEVALDMHSALDHFQVQSISLLASGMHLCSWEISPELPTHVCFCECAYVSNPSINVTPVSNGSITRHKLVSNNT